MNAVLVASARASDLLRVAIAIVAVLAMCVQPPAQAPAANLASNSNAVPPPTDGLRTKQEPQQIGRDITAEQRADILMARKMYRAAADSYQERLVELTKERADYLRLSAVSLRAVSRDGEAKAAEAEAKVLDKNTAELQEKQQYLPGSGSNFFKKLLAALGLVSDSPKMPTDLTKPEPPAVVAAGVKEDVQIPEGLTLKEQVAFLAANNRHAEAAEILSALERQTQRKQAVIWNKIGIAYHQMLDFAAASRCYRESVRTDPLYSEARNNLGTVHYAQKQYSRAIGEYKKALEVSPYSASVYSNLGTAHFAKKEYEEASVNYAKAVQIDPQIFEHQGSQGTILQQRNIEDRANFHFYLSKVYARNGDVNRSLIYMRKALEEGFKNRRKFVEDEDFAVLQENPDFQTLLQTEFRVL